ncbi:hypothetical protein RJ55_02290 [Drechmeria coniospora]|nr:hypothetical protein RJ55_02290 [Drechmeria coniospora]
MKLSTALGLVVAPLAAARQARTGFSPANPVSRLKGVAELNPRKITVIENATKNAISVDSKAEVIIIWANPGNGADTTSLNSAVNAAQSATAVEGKTGTAPAKGSATHTVKVGGPGGLTYQPDQLQNVPVGDMVVFEFLSQNHTVTQSPFDTPCKALPGGMDSGYQPNPNNSVSPPPQVAMQIMTSAPLWFYCRQKGHCGKGMVFSINPTEAKSQAIFQQMAIAQNGTGQASPITGGSTANNPAQRPAGSEMPAAGVAQPTGSLGSGGGEMSPGRGTLNADGSCDCVASCSFGSFPAQNQGLGSIGGMGGSLPMNMAARR